jgi:glycosyltransferase involved in cell wall biosynthesis
LQKKESNISFSANNKWPRIFKEYKSDLITFLNFGIISRYKRVDVLINAAVLAYEKTNLKFIVKIAGRCKNWDSYQSLIKYPFLFDLRIESIPNEEVADLFASSHYFVLPYQDISQSGALMVALNYNLPVLASNVRSFSEFIVDGRTGFLFETASVNSLSNLIVHILENHKTIYQFLKLQQKKFVDDNFSIDTIVNKYSVFFNKIINENSRSC